MTHNEVRRPDEHIAPVPRRVVSRRRALAAGLALAAPAIPSPPPGPAVLGRWPLFDRHGSHVRDRVVMARSSWESLPPATRPDGHPDQSGATVLAVVPAGWPGVVSR